MIEADRPLSVRDVAEMLGVHVNTVKRLPLPYFRVGSRGDRRYELRDVIAYKLERKVA